MSEIFDKATEKAGEVLSESKLRGLASLRETAPEAAQKRWEFEKFPPVHRGLSGELKSGRGMFWPIGYKQTPTAEEYPTHDIEREWATPELLKDFLVMLEGAGGKPIAPEDVFKGFVGPSGARIGARVAQSAIDNLLTGAKVDPAILGINVPPKRYYSSVLTLTPRSSERSLFPSKDVRIGIFDKEKGGAMVAIAEGEVRKQSSIGMYKDIPGDTLKIGWVRTLKMDEEDILNKIGIKATRDVEKVKQPGHHGRLPIGGSDALKMARKTQEQIPSLAAIAGYRVSGARKADPKTSERKSSSPFGGRQSEAQQIKRKGETPREAFKRVYQETEDPIRKREAARQAAIGSTGTYERLPVIDHLTKRVLQNIEKLSFQDLKLIGKMNKSFRQRIIDLVKENPRILRKINREYSEDFDELVSPKSSLDFAEYMTRKSGGLVGLI